MDLNWRRYDPANEECYDFDKFQQCSFGEDCRYKHKAGPFKQDFFLGTILHVEEKRITVKKQNGRIREFIRARHDEKRERKKNDKRRRAEPGDVVVFQVSNCIRRENLEHGRIVANFNKFQPMQEIEIESLRRNGFTIDPPDTRLRDNALTVEKCKDHESCTIFGIHVVVVAVEVELKYMKSLVYERHEKRFWGDYASFDRDKLMLALSMYEHSSVHDVRGPVFTPLVVEQTYTYHDRQLYQDKMDVLWSHFIKDNELELTFNSHCGKNYFVDSPDSWRERMLMDEIMKKYSSGMTKYITKQSDCHFITKTISLTQRAPEQHKMFPTFKDLSDRAQSAVKMSLTAEGKQDGGVAVEVNQQAFLNPSGKELEQNQRGKENSDLFSLQNGKSFDVATKHVSFILANALRSMTPIRALNEKYYPVKFERDVMYSEDICNGMEVKSTSPLRDFQHFINQQVVIRRMLGINRQLYSKEDLLGILSIRYRKPCIAKSFVRDVVEDEVMLDYAGRKVDSTLHKVNIKVFSPAASNQTNACEWKLTLAGVTCEKQHYCNRNLCFLEGEKLENLMHEIKKNGTLPREAKKSFIEMCENSIEKESPYRAEESGTMFTLQKGVELQLQISNDDAYERNDLGLRLLRVGEDCHLCLTHLNHPEKAFMSDRKDIRSLIHPKLIDEWKQKRKEALESLVLKDVETTWDGNCFSGGHFKAPGELHVAARDLVCIRKEMRLPTGEFDQVWCCHGIISRANNDIICFSVCTLSQPEPNPGSDGFCIEIVKNPLKGNFV